jgi:phosphate transport system protein
MMTDQHICRAFDRDLQSLRRNVGDLGMIAEQTVVGAIAALVKCDRILAWEVIATGSAIEARRRDIEGMATLTIARRQPMASDLREVVGALRICRDLEDIGILSRCVAERAQNHGPLAGYGLVRRGFERVGELVVARLAKALNAYGGHDSVGALTAWSADEETDRTGSRLRGDLQFLLGEDARNIAPCVELLFCAADIERVGNHSARIAETVHFMVHGSRLVDRQLQRHALPTAPLLVP